MLDTLHNPPENPSQMPKHGWVLYDGDCGFCSRWVRKVEGVLRKRGFAIASLQAEWVRTRISQPESELLQDMRLLLADDTLIAGADAYLYIMRYIFWTWPFALLFRLPGLHTLFCCAYRAFASNRHRLSRALGGNKACDSSKGHGYKDPPSHS